MNRQSQDPLPHRNGGKYTVPKVCCKVGHPPAGTRRTKPPILAGEGDEQLIVARLTAHTRKAVAEESAAQVALKLVANEGRKLAAGIALLRFDEEGRQVFANNAVEQGLFWLAMLVSPPSGGTMTDLLPLRSGTREHQPPPSTAGARRLRRCSASAAHNTGGLRSSGIPDVVRSADTALAYRACPRGQAGFGRRHDRELAHYVRSERT